MSDFNIGDVTDKIDGVAADIKNKVDDVHETVKKVDKKVDGFLHRFSSSAWTPLIVIGIGAALIGVSYLLGHGHGSSLIGK